LAATLGGRAATSAAAMTASASRRVVCMLVSLRQLSRCHHISVASPAAV